MSSKVKVLKVCVFVLLLLVVFAILFVIHFRTGNWWQRPKFDKQIESLAVYQGMFRHAGSKPTLLVDAESAEGREILKAFRGGWFYWNMVKFGKDYTVDVIYADGKRDSIGIGADYISMGSHDGTRDGVYKMRTDLSALIQKQTLQLAGKAPRGAEGGGGSEEICEGVSPVF